MYNSKLFATLLLAAMMLSCDQIRAGVDDIQSDSNAAEYTKLNMFLPSLEIDEDVPATKVEAIVASKTQFVWTESDMVGIFPTSGSQLYFSMANGVGTSSASFDGGGWALIRTADYFSYYPFVPDFYINKDAIPLTYMGQEQTGNANPDRVDVGKYCYMVAKGEFNPTSQALEFNYKKLGVLFRFKLPVDAGSYESLTIEIDDNLIAYEGTFKAINIDAKINDQKYTNKMTLSLKNISFDKPETLVAFMMLPPFNILNKQMTLSLVKSDGTVVKASCFGKDYQADKVYGYLSELSVYAMNAEMNANGGTTQLVINASDEYYPYEVSTDVDWITLQSSPTSGSTSINMTVGENTGEVERVGYVTVSRNKAYNNTTIKLQDKVKIVQSPSAGLTVGLEDWEKSDIDYGGVAQ
ncbi:MAG: fimbrillin family protein [Bacteroidales bacterium]|nr:fimbrillin family protein [Bacteroidales bacterium]